MLIRTNIDTGYGVNADPYGGFYESCTSKAKTFSLLLSSKMGNINTLYE